MNASQPYILKIPKTERKQEEYFLLGFYSAHNPLRLIWHMNQTLGFDFALAPYHKTNTLPVCVEKKKNNPDQKLYFHSVHILEADTQHLIIPYNSNYGFHQSLHIAKSIYNPQQPSLFATYLYFWFIHKTKNKIQYKELYECYASKLLNTQGCQIITFEQLPAEEQAIFVSCLH